MAVVEATDLPVIVYDIPGRTGVRITDDTLARLAEHERVLAVKDVTGDVEQAFRRMEATGLAYYSGDDGLNFAFLAHGASGVVSVVAHADAHSWREMITEVDAGDLAGARAVARRIRPLVQAIMGGGQGNDYKAQYPDVDWVGIMRMRNLVAHHYDKVNGLKSALCKIDWIRA